MSHAEAEIAFRVIQSGFATFGLVYLMTAIITPAWFLKWLSIERLDRRSATWRVWCQGFLTVVAVGVLVYAALYAVISAIPYGWGGENEDGDWEATRDTFRYTATFILTVGASVQLEKNAKILAREPAESLARRVLTEVIVAARTDHPEVIREARQRIDTALTSPEFERRTAAAEERDVVRGRLLDNLRG